jgi:hypothetical protein
MFVHLLTATCNVSTGLAIGEAERILSCKGRVFAMDDEPDVPRLWLPDQDAPGLAMARAFGDFCLKNHGLICTPEVYYRKLSEKDDFLVLATDGVRRVIFSFRLAGSFDSSFLSISVQSLPHPPFIIN